MPIPLLDFNSVLTKAQKYCAYQERCHWDVEKKFKEWQVAEEIQDEVLAALITGNFLNEERFARQFSSGRFRMKQWGRIKISLELKKRQVSSYSINKALTLIDEEEYRLTLQKLIAKKSKEINTSNSFEKTQKIAQYLYTKGYESELIWDALERIENE